MYNIFILSAFVPVLRVVYCHRATNHFYRHLNKSHAHIISIVLLMLFSCRIIVPVYLNCTADSAFSIEQQEEKSADDNSNDWMYEADLPVAFHAISIQACFTNHFLLTGHELPALHFMSIPTPPPWSKS